MYVLLGCVLLMALACWLALDFVYQQTMSHGSDNVNASVTVSTNADDKVYSEFTVAAAGTVNYTGCAGDPADVKAIMIKTSVAMTLTINYASGADDVYALGAGEPLGWNAKMSLGTPFVNPAAITSMDFANAGAAEGTVTLMIGRDSTT